jgi:beta-glucanase (GH16 family)
MTAYLFQDEFDGPAGSPPDPSKWNHETSPGTWPYNGELETYTDSTANAFLDGNNHLVIRAIKTSTGFTSARLNSFGKFAHAYGTWEARIKFKSQHGLWPAWWMMGANEPTVGWPKCGEVDMLEDYGWSTVESTVHVPNRSGTGMLTPVQGKTYADVPVDAGWHVWKMTWTPTRFTFFKEPASMVLNLAVGGAAGAPHPTTVFPADFVFDYVRVY